MQYPAPVYDYESGASPDGALNMAGNVWEWVGDYFDVDYYASSPRENPPGPNTGTTRTIRGGSWFGSDLDAFSSFRYGLPPDFGTPWSFEPDDMGFRCARTP